MNLANYLSPDSILVGQNYFKDKWNLIQEMVDALIKSPVIKNQNIIDREIISNAVVEREKKGSTGIGDGMAFTHARLKDIDAGAISLAILQNPIDFDSHDLKPVQFACMIITPENQPIFALKVMSLLAEFLSSKNTQQMLLKAQTPENVHSIIDEHFLNLDISITAKDIMKKPNCYTTPETPIKEASKMMANVQTDSVPVLDSSKTVVGELSCEQLFHVGLPDFFTQLKSVSFIKDYDPFEKYFYEEAHSKVKDVMSKRFSVLPNDATLLEIVFELTIRKHPKVYITDESNKIIGYIDQVNVLDRIINL